MMNNVLPSWPLMSAFLVASVVLAVTPGPGVFYIVTRSAVQGRRSGMTSVAGVALGNLANAVGASVGLAALFAISSLAFTVVKYAGAMYLIWLGIQMLRPGAVAGHRTLPLDAALARVFRDAFVVALLNPKTAIFFAAFLPQFLDPGAATLPHTLVLACVFVVIALATDSGYALAASFISPAFSSGALSAVGRRIGGGIFIGLGVLAALAAGDQEASS